MAKYHTELEQLRQENAAKEAFLKQSGVLKRDGPKLSDQDLKWEALKETTDKVLELSDQQYRQGLQDKRPKTPQEQHFDKALDRYADRFKNHKPEFNEQGRDEKSRDDEMQR